jgi:uncharacterized membrane protein
VTETPPVKAETGQGMERVVFFSDAVIAIALTLLALELQVPVAHDGISIGQDFAEKMGHQYEAFLISFGVISAFWMNHHRLFRNIVALGPLMVRLNLVGLFAIVLTPFATKLITELSGTEAKGWGVAFYAAVICLWWLVYFGMVWDTNRSHLWSADVQPSTPRTMVIMNAAAFLPFLLSIPVAFINHELATYMWLLVIPSVIITGRIRRRMVRRAESPSVTR